MALNPPVLVGGIPMGIVGEVFCLQRSGMYLELDAGLPSKIKATGSVFLTTVRICFVPEKPTPGFAGLDIPLQGICDEDFCQPIFGANYLKGKVAPVPGRGILSPTAPFKLYFYHGGCTTFLKVFFDLMGKYKMADAAARAAFLGSQRAVQAFIRDQQAYVDPTDPSVIFITQPAAMEAGGRLPASAVPYAPAAFAPVPLMPVSAPVSYSGGGSGGFAPPFAPPPAGYSAGPAGVAFAPAAAAAGSGSGGAGGYSYPPPIAPVYASAAPPVGGYYTPPPPGPGYGAPPQQGGARTAASGAMVMQTAATGARFF